MDDLKKKYSELQKKFNLPKFEEIDSAFSIKSIETNENIERAIVSKIIEKTDMFSKMLDSEIIQPEASLATMHEAAYLTDADREKTRAIFTRIMKLNREALLLSLKNYGGWEKFVKKATKEWDSIKKELIPFYEKILKCWEEEAKTEEEVKYFG